MAHHQHSNLVTNDPKKKMVRKSFEVHSSKIAFTDSVGFGSICYSLKGCTQFLVEPIGELRPRDISVLLHNPRDIGCNELVKLDAH